MPNKKFLYTESLGTNFKFYDRRVLLVQDLVSNVQRALYTTYSEFEGDLGCEDDLECLIEDQLISLQKAMKIPQKAGDEARCMVSKKLLALFRLGKLGNFTLDIVPNVTKHTS